MANGASAHALDIDDYTFIANDHPSAVMLPAILAACCGHEDAISGLDILDAYLIGLEVIFAHPERIRYFQDDLARYEAVVHQGAVGQITTGSLLGVFGSEIAEISEEMMVKGLVHVLASDAHNIRGRPPLLSDALEVAIDQVGEERAMAMVLDAPRALIEGREPELPPVEAPRGGGGFFARLFGRG